MTKISHKKVNNWTDISTTVWMPHYVNTQRTRDSWATTHQMNSSAESTTAHCTRPSRNTDYTASRLLTQVTFAQVCVDAHVTIGALPLPRCVLMLMYRAVPVRLLCSRYGMCLCVSGSMYSFASPKSIMWMTWRRLADWRPTRKFSGFTSR